MQIAELFTRLAPFIPFCDLIMCLWFAGLVSQPIPFTWFYSVFYRLLTCFGTKHVFLKWVGDGHRVECLVKQNPVGIGSRDDAFRDVMHRQRTGPNEKISHV
jgi:hypothetical protein